MDNLPPQNIELEQSILNTCLYHPDETVFDILKPSDFYKTAHQKIFNAICALKETDEPIDILSVTAKIQDRGQLEEIGGASYFGVLVGVPIAVDPEYTAKKIKGYSQLRRMIELSNAISKKCFSAESDDVEKIIDYAQTEILKVGTTDKNLFKSINEIVFDSIERCEELQDSGGITGVPSGFTDLDALTCGFQPGDLILLAGRPSMGKTALANNCMLNGAEQGFKSAMCQLEMTNIQTGNRFLASEGRLNSLKFRSGRFSGEDWAKLTNAASRISSYPIYIDDNPVSHYKDIQKKARFAFKNYGIQSLWIDYLGFIDGDESRSKVDEIQTISRGLKALAKEISIPVILLCQLSRECEKRNNKRPVLSDLRDSGALEQDADVVMFIYRDEVYNKDSPDKGTAEIWIRKQRNGPIGTIKLAWLEQYARFENLAWEDIWQA
jgi:replicative DNA helicase